MNAVYQQVALILIVNLCTEIVIYFVHINIEKTILNVFYKLLFLLKTTVYGMNNVYNMKVGVSW